MPYNKLLGPDQQYGVDDAGECDVCGKSIDSAACTCTEEECEDGPQGCTCPLSSEFCNDDICSNNHQGADTSVLANPSQQCKEKSQKTILAALARVGEASCERLEIITGITHQSLSARLSELLRDNRIKITGRTTTISGKPARLYRIV